MVTRHAALYTALVQAFVCCMLLAVLAASLGVMWVAVEATTIATTAQRRGQGMALRTAMRGALIVRRLLNSLKRIWAVSRQNRQMKKPQQANLCGFVVAGKKR